MKKVKLFGVDPHEKVKLFEVDPHEEGKYSKAHHVAYYRSRKSKGHSIQKTCNI
jgi:hypothetical protein